MILLSLAVGIYLYPQFPFLMASHWNIQGVVDGYISRFWGVFLMPLVSFFMFLLFLVIPRIDPLKANVAKFRKYFDWFIVLIMVFFLLIYAFSLRWNLGGFKFDIFVFLPPASGILFYYCGILIENTKRNWFIGIRTPWTLSSDTVWDKTHKIGGKLFKYAGVLALLGIFFRDWAFYLTVVPAIFVAVYSTFYSYFEYRKEAR